MWSWCRRPFGRIQWSAAGTAALFLPAAPLAFGQEVYFNPRFEVGAEYHTNRELVADPALEDPMIEYRGMFEAVTGRRTPRSQIELRPKIIAQEFPDRSGIDPIELFCDLDYTFHTQRSEFEFLTRYARQDSFNAEYGDANFDPFEPHDSGATDTGITYIGDTRQRIRVEPDYSFAISQLMRLGVRANYDNVNFYANDDRPAGTTGLVGYDSVALQPYVSRQFGQQFTGELGAFASQFEADDNSNKSDNYGISLSGHYNWQIWEVGGLATYQYSEIDRAQATLSDENQSNWGLEFYGVRKGQVNTLRFDVGHFIEPSSAASMIETNQLRVQYDHFLSPRLLFNGAVRIKESERLGALSGITSDFARAELSLRWRMTFSWFIRVGYRYAWRDATGPANSGNDNAALLSFGYRGMGPSE